MGDPWWPSDPIHWSSTSRACPFFPQTYRLGTRLAMEQPDWCHGYVLEIGKTQIYIYIYTVYIYMCIYIHTHYINIYIYPVPPHVLLTSTSRKLAKENAKISMKYHGDISAWVSPSYTLWLWHSQFAMENQHHAIFRTVKHLFRLGPWLNHGELWMS